MRTRATLTALLIAVVAVACSPPSAEDLVMNVIRTRNNFEVRLTSWLDRGAETTQPYLYLDVEVLKNTEDSLTRLTVLVEQLDASENVLSSQRVPIDVSDMDVRGRPGYCWRLSTSFSTSSMAVSQVIACQELRQARRLVAPASRHGSQLVAVLANSSSGRSRALR